MATRIAAVAIRWLRRFSLTHQPASTSFGAIPSMPSPAKRSSAAPRKLLSPRARIAHGPNPCSRHCSSAARVSRSASSEFPDARAWSASSSGERGVRISRAVRRVIACSAESPTERRCTPLIIARTLRGHSRTLAHSDDLLPDRKSRLPGHQGRCLELLLAFPVLDRGSGPREHDVFVLGVLSENLSGVEVLDDFAADHRGEHENANRRVCSVDDLMRTVLPSRKADDVTLLQLVLAFGRAYRR